MKTYSGKEADKVWYTQIPLSCGRFIYLYSLGHTTLLKAWSTKHRKTARKIAEDFGDKVDLDTDYEGYEFTLIFPPDLLKEIAGRLGARRRRQLTPEQKEKAVERLKKYRFKPAPEGSHKSVAE